MRKIIAVLEDNADRVRVMREWLTDRLGMYEHYFSDDPETLIAYLRPRADDILLVSLDHDLHERPDGNTTVTGMDVTNFLLTLPPHFPVVIHSTNAIEAARMRRRLKAKDWRVTAVVPFDDTRWIGNDWYPAVKRALRAAAKAVTTADNEAD